MFISFAIILGLIQAFTEFLPVSSSGHLAVAEVLLKPIYENFQVPLVYNVLLHVGTLLVIIFFLKREIKILLKSLFSNGQERKDSIRFFLVLGTATLPATVVGLLLRDRIAESFHSLIVVGYCFLITTALLEAAYRNQRNRKQEELSGDSLFGWDCPSFVQAFLIGVAQSVALLPGVSRSGTTVVSALLLKVKPEASVRFSLFMAIPAIFGALVLEADSFESISAADYSAYLWGFVVCVIGSWLAVHSLLWVVRQVKYRYFAIYTFLLSMFCLTYGYLNR